MSPALPDPEHLRRISALLDVALALEPHEREAWMSTLPEEVQALVPMLRSMLSRGVIETDDFMRRPLKVSLADADDMVAPDNEAGDLVGPYRLLRELGAGGMATVWLAERADGSLQRQVALKLPREGWALGLAQRMARERDILAALEHPHIARLYDAGITVEGRPWLAMECVDGVPIDVFCREHGLDVEQRLRLFLQVADAVAHAHARLIVHRDLKPSNILVTPASEVRLLDFGVAKLLQADPSAMATRLTEFIGRPVTPDYASPEQVSGASVTVSTDVYSLGVVLYELLTGQRPYRLGRVSTAALEEAILMATVPPASARASHDKRLARRLRGDLDTIIAKAMKKRPEQRYRSVEAFAGDIQRHLSGEPVLARPDSTWYRLYKALGRHRVAAGATAAVTLALVAGTALALWQAREAALERDQARALLARNEAVNEFFTMLFTEAAAPEQAEAINQMLERGAQMLTPAFGQTPEHEAAILRILAEYFHEPERSDALLQRAAEITRHSTDLGLRAQIDCDRGQTMEALGQAPQAVAMLDRWIRNPLTPDLAAVRCLQMRGAIASNNGDPKVALQSAQTALSRLHAAGLSGSEGEAELLGDIGLALHHAGRSMEAGPYFEDSQRLYRALNRQDSLHARVMLSNWGLVELATGNARSALLRYDELLASHARLMAWRPAPSWVVGNRAVALERMGRWPQALDAYAETVRVSEQVRHVLGQRFGLVGMASVQLAMGNAAQAQLTLDRAGSLGGDPASGHPAFVRAGWVHARLALANGRAAEAHERLTRSLADLRARGADQAHVGVALRMRAEAALALGRVPDAETDAREALAIAQGQQGGRAHSDETGLAWLGLGEVESKAGRPLLARQAFEQAIDHLSHTASAESPDKARAQRLLGAL